MFLVLLEGKHADLQSCVIKPFETETRLYLNGHNSCNIPCFHNSQSENTIIKMKCCRSLWVVFIVNTNETWHLTHYVLFKDNTCFSHPTVHISSSRILSLCHRGCKVQEKKKKKDFFMETRFCSAASHGLVPKDPNDDEETKLSPCHTATFIKPSQDPTLPSPDHSWWTPELHWEFSMQKWI